MKLHTAEKTGKIPDILPANAGNESIRERLLRLQAEDDADRLRLIDLSVPAVRPIDGAEYAEGMTLQGINPVNCTEKLAAFLIGQHFGSSPHDPTSYGTVESAIA